VDELLIAGEVVVFLLDDTRSSVRAGGGHRGES
jgi:hypothetical protein